MDNSYGIPSEKVKTFTKARDCFLTQRGQTFDLFMGIWGFLTLRLIKSYINRLTKFSEIETILSSLAIHCFKVSSYQVRSIMDTGHYPFGDS